MDLSKEEKKAKKEAKVLKLLKEKEERMKRLKREELKREIRAQTVRRQELERNWKELMLKIKEPVFKQDIEVMWHTFERALDKKDHQIQYTIKLMNVAENQSKHTIGNFCNVIDTMINNFLENLERLSKESNIRTEKCLKSGDVELSKIRRDHDAAEKHLQLLIFQGHKTSDSLAWTKRGIYLVKEDEERNKYINKRDTLRSYLENSYSNMWDEYKSILKIYVTNTAKIQKEMRKLRRKVNIMDDVLASQVIKIKNSEGLLKHLRTELSAYESGKKQAEHRERCNRFREAYHRLQKMLTDDGALDKIQIALLVSASNSAIEWLETGYRKGDKILRLAALCRKYETQREKILPFACTTPQSQDTIPVEDTQLDDNALIINALSSNSDLTRLWQKISNVEISKMALLQEKKRLEKENIIISQKLQLEDNKIVPDAKKCICAKQQNFGTSKPVAIEGVLELYKFNNI